MGRDPDAGAGHRNKSGDHEEGIFYGSHVTLAVATKARRVTGNRKKAKFGQDENAYVVGADLSAAGTSAATVGVHAAVSAREVCPNACDATADIGFTQLRPTFNRTMHEMDFHVTMDIKPMYLEAARPVKIGPHGYPAFIHGGALLVAFTPKNMRVPAPDLSDEELFDFYERRKPFELIAVQHFDNGDKQFVSPIHRGHLNVDPNKRTGARGQPLYPRPADFEEHFGEIPDDVIYQRFITVGVEHLDDFQLPPHGTRAQDESYGRRQQSENAIGQIKEDYGLSPKKCRIIGDGGRTIAAISRVVWYNLNITRKAKNEKQARRADNAAKPKTHPLQSVAIQDAATTPDDNNDSPEIAEPRAPP
ncbi:hypothetical protein [Candidatus Poriferisodalis sp.]|uniref:hypothetical protein n=1 Tax=Candidatus Poriferisodalis sp. TaxID=3101277 RepID=UPI003B01C19D